MKKSEDKPYLEKPLKKETTKEQLIYGTGETLKEKEERSENQKKILITE